MEVMLAALSGAIVSDGSKSGRLNMTIHMELFVVLHWIFSKGVGVMVGIQIKSTTFHLSMVALSKVGSV